MKSICQIKVFRRKAQAEAAVALLEVSGIKAAISPEDLGRGDISYGGKGVPLFVYRKDSQKASGVLERAALFAAKALKTIQLPPEEGTLEFLDMLIHDCRQYLMIVIGELKSIEEEGELELDEPTNDIEKITIRLKRLKSQCARMTGRKPLDWQR